MDLRALAVLAVLAIHALLVGFALRGAGRGRPAHRDLAIQAALVTLWSAGRLATFFGAVESGLAALIAGLVACSRSRLGWARITVPLATVAVGLLAAHAVLGPYAQPVVVPWLAAAGAVHLLPGGGAPARRRAPRPAPLPPTPRRDGGARARRALASGRGDRRLRRSASRRGRRAHRGGPVLAMIRSRQVDLEPEAGSVLVRLGQAVATSAVVLVGVAIVNRYLGVDGARVGDLARRSRSPPRGCSAARRAGSSRSSSGHSSPSALATARSPRSSPASARACAAASRGASGLRWSASSRRAWPTRSRTRSARSRASRR
ncbi:MAG: hypothetical protein IPK07_14815 [Deltaproteobacteria bacterium]|nr:hypothetical protein [Deltaproteobacteria bacterium]